MPNLVPSSFSSQTLSFCFYICICILIVLFKFLRSNLFIMAPLKLPSNFKYKALFYSKFLAFMPKPFALESPPFKTLNDLHSGFDPNVFSSSNTIIVETIMNLEQDLELLKSTMKKWKYEFDWVQDVWVVQLPWVEFVINGDGLVSSIRCIIYSKVESRENLLIPKLEFLLKHSTMRKTIFTILGWKLENFMRIKNVHTKKIKFYLPKSLLILFSNLLLIKVWLLTRENLFNLLSFCTCYLMTNFENMRFLF